MARVPTITIINHQVNNITSIASAYEALGCDVVVADTPSALQYAGHLVLPGVGSFAASVSKPNWGGWYEAIWDHVEQGNPLFGICLGFQLLYDFGKEGGYCRGLGFLQGTVDRLPSPPTVPHVGWNQIEIQQPHPIFEDVENGAHMYFVHSYRPTDTFERDVLTRTTYGESFISSMHKASVVGTQFHPEKSGADGLRVLLNFSKWRP